MIGALVGLGLLTLLFPLARPPRREIHVGTSSPGRPNGTRSGVLRRPLAPRRRALIAIAAAIAGLVVVGVLPTLAMGVAGVAWPRARCIGRRRAAQRRVDAALPSTIEMLVLVVHAGLTPHQAVELLCERAPPPARPALREVRRRTLRGTPLAEALSALPEILGPSAASVADTLAMAERHGTPIAHALEQLSLEARERRRRRSEATARTLPVRMSFPLVGCTLPSFVLVAIAPAVMAAMVSLGDSGF